MRLWLTLDTDPRNNLRFFAVLAASAIALAAHAHAQEPSAASPPTYGARARVVPPAKEGEAHAEPPAATASLAQYQGPSFSWSEVMPGVVPVFSGVPYVIVRGAPPASTRSYYDGVAVPTMFHVALMPAIVDPHLIGGMRLYPAVGPARFGRKLGGAFVVDGPQLTPRLELRELSLSLLDASGYLQTPLDDASRDAQHSTTLAAAWRVGDPSLALTALGQDARLAYYDYNLRLERRSGAERWLVLALGAGDRLGDRAVPEDDIGLDFQRLLVRYARTSARVEVGSELQLGYDASTLGQELNGRALRITPGAYVQWQKPHLRARLGADLSATLVSLERRPSRAPRNDRDNATLPRAPDFTLAPQEFLDRAPLASAPTREAFGAYGELTLEPSSRLRAELGVRADVYQAGGSTEVGVDPSLRITHRTSERWTSHAALGLAHAPASSPIPLPGLDDVALDRGMQTAVQSEVGTSVALDHSTHADATLFYERFIDTVFLELILDCQGNSNPDAAQAAVAQLPAASSICRRPSLPRADGDTYGAELYIERALTKRLSGFASYTLAFADATAEDGTSFTPQSDVRHVLNAVAQYDLGRGFGAGVRLHARTGKMGVNTIFDVPNWRFQRIERRLPGFSRLDLNATYAFRGPVGRMQLRVSWLNVTFSREATKRDCAFDENLEIVCRIHYQPAIVLPNIALQGEL